MRRREYNEFGRITTMPRPGKHVLSTVKSQETSALISTEKKIKDALIKYLDQRIVLAILTIIQPFVE